MARVLSKSLRIGMVNPELTSIATTRPNAAASTVRIVAMNKAWRCLRTAISALALRTASMPDRIDSISEDAPAQPRNLHRYDE